jgi:hypothetical protein
MNIMFARAYGSILQAERLNQEDFPGSQVPEGETFSSIDQRLFHNHNAITNN